MSHRYRGHRANSFEPLDINELVEIRSRQRTFHGAYSRTALSNLASSLTILRLFDERFDRIGLLFAILGSVLFALAAIRSRHSRHDFADSQHDEGERVVIKTVGMEGTRIYGRPYITAGWVVLGVALVVASVEIGLFVLVIQL